MRECDLQHVGKFLLITLPTDDKIVEILHLKPNKCVCEIIQKNFGKLVTLKDISKMKVTEKTHKGLQEPQLLLDCIQNLTKQDESAQTGVVVDEEHMLQLCYIQTSHMINLFEKFPEIVFIDGTYNVNSHGMPLYCIMIEDGYG